jgi:hypothetical protein
MAANGKKTDELERIQKEGSSHSLLEALSWRLLGNTEENHENLS